MKPLTIQEMRKLLGEKLKNISHLKNSEVRNQYQKLFGYQ